MTLLFQIKRCYVLVSLRIQTQFVLWRMRYYIWSVMRMPTDQALRVLTHWRWDASRCEIDWYRDLVLDGVARMEVVLKARQQKESE